VSIEQIYAEGWSPAEAAGRVPDLKGWLAKKLLEVWGRVGSNAAEPTLIPSLGGSDFFVSNVHTTDPIMIRGLPVFDLRIFPILYSPRAADYLNGLSLADAFRDYVVRDCEIRSMSGRIMELCPRNGLIFLDGRFPSIENCFHWPLKITSAEIASAFVNSRLDLPGSEPSVVENAASCVLAARVWALTDRLAWGHIAAFGTFADNGTEGPIGLGQWRRQNIWLDVRNSDLCELRDGRYVAIWTGVHLRLPNRHVPQSVVRHLLAEPTKARKQIQTKDNCRRQCTDWLYSIMVDPTFIPRSNEGLWAKATSKWPDKLSRREFNKCRADVLATLDENQRYRWERPGPKPKSLRF